MAATVTLQSLRERALRLADLTVDEFRSTSDVNGLVNTHRGSVHDLLVQVSPNDYFSDTWTITVTSGVTAYALPGNFRSLSSVYEVTGTGSSARRRDVYQVRPGLMHQYSVPSGGSVQVEYIPQPAALSADADTIDVQISGADELIVALVARDLREMGDLSTSGIERSIARLEQRIKRNAPRRYRGPQFVTDIDAADDENDWRVQSTAPTTITGWRLRDGYLELYSGGP